MMEGGRIRGKVDERVRRGGEMRPGERKSGVAERSAAEVD